MKFILDRKNCIAFLVIGWLVRGMAYHFFPLVNDILTWGTVLWILVNLLSQVIKKELKFDALTLPLFGLLLAMVIATVLNLESIRVWKDLEISDVIISIIEAAGLFGILFTAARHEDSKEYTVFLNDLFRIVFGYVCLLALASVFLFVCYRMDYTLPGGFGSADQIFTYGHMGEETRFCGLFGYSTDGGNLCALSAAIGIYLYEQKKIPLVIMLAGTVLLIGTIVLLDVRTSMVALLLNGLLLGGYLLGKKTGRKKAAGIMLGIFVLLVAAAVILKKDAIRYYLELYRENPRDTVIFLTTGRSEYWEAAVHGWLEKPVFGWGWLNNAYIGFYFDNHNVFFNLLLWTGAAGLGLFVIFAVIWFVHVIRRKEPVGIGVILIITAVCVQAMLDRAILGTANTGVETMCFWLCTGLLAYGCPMKSAREKKAS